MTEEQRKAIIQKTEQERQRHLTKCAARRQERARVEALNYKSIDRKLKRAKDAHRRLRAAVDAMMESGLVCDEAKYIFMQALRGQ